MLLSENELKDLEAEFLNPKNKRTTEENMAYIKSKWLYDLSYFSSEFLEENGYIINDVRVEDWPHFKEIWDALNSGEDINLIIARWHAKTTSVLIWILHSICYGIVKNILYIANSDLGSKGIGKIRGELETNQNLILYFGNLVPTNSDDVKDKSLKKWRDKELEFTNGCHLQTLSPWQKVRWQRPQKIIFDDPQDNKEVKNKRIVDEFNTRVFTSLYNTLLPWGSMVAIGTIIGNLCLVKHLRDVKRWKTIEKQACDDNFENILWEKMRSKESLYERCYGHIEIDTEWVEYRAWGIWLANFNQEYRNMPLSFTNGIIREERCLPIKKEDLPEKFDRKMLSIDPASTDGKTSDFTGAVSVAFAWHDIYALKSRGVKLSPLKNEEYIKNRYTAEVSDYVLKEDNIERGMAQHLKEKNVNVHTVIAKGDKGERLSAISIQLELGYVHFVVGECDNLIYQLTHYPEVENDDEMDAFVHALSEKKQRAVWIRSF